MPTRTRKLRKRAGVPLAKATETPTPFLERSHTWRHHRSGAIRPTRIGIRRYGIRDIGWLAPSKYVTKRGELTKAAAA